MPTSPKTRTLKRRPARPGFRPVWAKYLNSAMTAGPGRVRIELVLPCADRIDLRAIDRLLRTGNP